MVDSEAMETAGPEEMGKPYPTLKTGEAKIGFKNVVANVLMRSVRKVKEPRVEGLLHRGKCHLKLTLAAVRGQRGKPDGHSHRVHKTCIAQMNVDS